MEKIEIKFRAWDNGKMCYWNINEMYESSFFGGAHKKLMQYTGLKDKNGKEGYHKDIAASGKKLYIIEWQNEEARFLLLPTGSNTGTWKFMDELDRMEIVGDIYSTPHLLTP